MRRKPERCRALRQWKDWHLGKAGTCRSTTGGPFRRRAAGRTVGEAWVACQKGYRADRLPCGGTAGEKGGANIVSFSLSFDPKPGRRPGKWVRLAPRAGTKLICFFKTAPSAPKRAGSAPFSPTATFGASLAACCRPSPYCKVTG